MNSIINKVKVPFPITVIYVDIIIKFIQFTVIQFIDISSTVNHTLYTDYFLNINFIESN